MLADDDMKPLDEEGNEIDNDEDNDNNRIWLIKIILYNNFGNWY